MYPRLPLPYCSLTFKENTPDIRNSKTVDILRELASYGVEVKLMTLWLIKKRLEKYGIDLKDLSELKPSKHHSWGWT